MDTVDVEFEWFDPQPAVDFHGIKTLLRQLLDIDAQLFNLSELADLILSQPLLGSTVKVDGNETDPYAFLTVLNLTTHKVRPIPFRSHHKPIPDITPGQTSNKGLNRLPDPTHHHLSLTTPPNPALTHLPHANRPHPKRTLRKHGAPSRSTDVHHARRRNAMGA